MLALTADLRHSRLCWNSA